LQADNALREQAAEERRAIEESEWFKQKQADEVALRRAELECMEQMHARANEAREFLERERQEREEQEREGTVPTITRGDPVSSQPLRDNPN
jgi:hypothetical protein